MKKIKMIKTILSFILLTTIHTVVMGQVSDSVDYISNHQDTCKLHKFNVKQLIAPTTLIGIGIIGLGSDWMEYQNSEIRDYCCPVKPRFRDFSSRNPSKYGT